MMPDPWRLWKRITVGEGALLLLALAPLATLGACTPNEVMSPARRSEEAIEAPTATRRGARAGDALLRVPFLPASARLGIAARRILGRVATLARHRDAYIEVHGLCDPGLAAGATLARRRSLAVRAYLHRNLGVPLQQIGIRPLPGSASPITGSREQADSSDLVGAVVVVLAPPPG